VLKGSRSGLEMFWQGTAPTGLLTGFGSYLFYRQNRDIKWAATGDDRTILLSGYGNVA
jgi:hypothetical protein